MREEKIAKLCTLIRYRMDDIGRFSDATSPRGKALYNQAVKGLRLYQEQLILILQQGEE
tara:strand:+ start:293 stop:469 length:177 start_codon:yes stop_codon:yes gene_type:complete